MKYSPLAALALGALAATALSAHAAVTTVNITNDTYVDDYLNVTPDLPTVSNQMTNYGDSQVIKAVSDDGSGDTYYGTPSATHAMFTLPVDWSIIGNNAFTSATVNYYAKNNSLGNPAGQPTYDVYVYPLLQSFVAGTGGDPTSTRAGTPNTTSAAIGADWFSTNGKYDSNGNPLDPWTTPGGTYDAYTADPALLKETYDPATGKFSWDLTPILNDPILRQEAAANGLVLVVANENTFDGNVFASLYSGQSPSLATRPTFAYELGTTQIPEPATLSLLGLSAVPILLRRRAKVNA